MWFGRKRPPAGVLRLDVADTADLARFVVTSIGGHRVAAIDVRIASSKPPRGWFGSPGIASLVNCRAEVHGAGCRVRVSVEQPVDAAVLLAAAYRMIEPVRGVQATFVDALPPDATQFAADVRDVYADDVHAHLRRADVVVCAREEDVIEHATRIVVRERGAWQVDGRSVQCWIDPAVHRPMHRRSDPTPLTVTLPRTEWLTSAAVTGLRGATAVSGAWSDPAHTQLHASGVLLASETPDDGAPWQIAAEAHRRTRTAYQRSSPDAVLDTWPTVSAVMVTHRSEYLAAFLDQVRRFTYPRLEVIIGLHGLTEEVVPPGTSDFPHPIHLTTIDGHLPFGAAMQGASQRASGAYLTKLDDDDLYAPTHIWDLVIAERYSGAQLVGKALDWIFLADQDSTVFRPTYAAEKYGKFVAGGTLFISRAALAEVGGWRPVPRSIDLGLINAVRRHGGVVYRTQGFGYTYVRRSAGHTAQVDNAHFRTKITAEFPGLFQVDA